MERENKIAIALAIILSIVLMFVCTSCKTQYIQGETITKTITVTEHDTTIVVEPDSAAAVALLYCDSAYNVVLGDLEMSEGERINLEWKLSQKQKEGRSYAQIDIRCNEDSLMREISWRDSTINTLTERNIIQYVRQRNGYDRFTSGGFWVLLSAILLVIGIWAFKKFYEGRHKA